MACGRCGEDKKLHAGGLCNSCYGKARRAREKGLIEAGRRELDRLQPEPIMPFSPLCQAEEFMVISVDLSNHPDVYRALGEMADQDDRTPALQARHLLRQALTGRVGG